MGYCRFQNTYKDLEDCYDNMDKTNLSKEEQDAREELLELCKIIIRDYCEEEDSE